MARLDGTERVFLWEGEDPGPARVVLDQRGFIVSFASDMAAREAATAESWNVSTEDASVYDLDAIEKWCRSAAAVQDASALLNTWNLLLDLPSENLFRAADSRALSLYDKLFRGCNLPSMSVSGEHYEPEWTAGEVAALKHLLCLGLAELRARFR